MSRTFTATIKLSLRRTLLLPVILFSIVQVSAQSIQQTNLRKAFQSPPSSASPWVFWYWYQASVSKEGITADLKAMKEAGCSSYWPEHGYPRLETGETGGCCC